MGRRSGGKFPVLQFNAAEARRKTKFRLGRETNPSARQSLCFSAAAVFALICLSQPCKLLKARQRQSRAKHPVGRSYLQCNWHFDGLPPLSCSCAPSFSPLNLGSLSPSFSFVSPPICRRWAFNLQPPKFHLCARLAWLKGLVFDFLFLTWSLMELLCSMRHIPLGEAENGEERR